MEDALKKHGYVFSTMLICLCYCHYISTRIPKGLFRLISILPILCIFTFLPLCLPRIFSSVLIITEITALASGRLILLAFGQGPLSQPQSLFSFITAGALPIRNPSSKVPSQPTRKPTVLAIQFLAYAVLLSFWHKFHPKLLPLSYVLFTYLYLDFVLATLMFVMNTLFGIEIGTMFDEPYLSTSLHNFWGRRWNLVVSEMLGRVVYRPVRLASAALLGVGSASAPACLATFLVSGLFHELELYCLTRANPSWEMTGFFVVHGIGMVLESRLKKALNGRLNLPRAVSVVLTLGFVFFTALWLFVPPVIRGRVDVLVIAEFRSLGQFFQNGFTSLRSITRM